MSSSPSLRGFAAFALVFFGLALVQAALPEPIPRGPVRHPDPWDLPAVFAPAPARSCRGSAPTGDEPPGLPGCMPNAESVSTPLQIPGKLAAALRNARRVAAMTGAGVSAESGIPTFRDKMTGLWARYDPKMFVSIEGFRRDPKLVWEWHAWLRGLVDAAEPNPGHYALARLERLVPEFTLATQNIDNLHQRAGSRQVVQLHGDLFELRCSREGKVLAESDLDTSTTPPRCPCGAYARPAVVWFGEMLPPAALEEAANALRACDLCLIVGTSAVVYPAAGLVELTPRSAIRVVVNPERTGHSPLAQYTLQAPAGEALPALVEAAFGPAA